MKNISVAEKLSNALLECDNVLEKKIIEIIHDEATNPFVIYQNDYVIEEVLIERIQKAYSEKDVADAIEDLIEKRVVRKKGNIFTGTKRYSVTREAVSENPISAS